VHIRASDFVSVVQEIKYVHKACAARRGALGQSVYVGPPRTFVAPPR